MLDLRVLDPSRDQIDRLFRRSGLVRLKWERTDYRAGTLDRALLRDDVYEEPARVDEARRERQNGHATGERTSAPGRNGRTAHADAGASAFDRQRLSLSDFVAHLEAHKYLYRPTGKFWPRVSVNAAVSPVSTESTRTGSRSGFPQVIGSTSTSRCIR